MTKKQILVSLAYFAIAFLGALVVQYIIMGGKGVFLFGNYTLTTGKL